MIEKLAEQINQIKALVDDIHRLHFCLPEKATKADLKNNLKAQILLDTKKRR